MNGLAWKIAMAAVGAVAVMAWAFAFDVRSVAYANKDEIAQVKELPEQVQKNGKAIQSIEDSLVDATVVLDAIADELKVRIDPKDLQEKRKDLERRRRAREQKK